ncbi:MAG: Succinoglycan biosynthesis protein ExoO, partial [Devosia sp.]|nr:Succinoglycan biosynthesis protein ExoO [Devosia sp.]
DWVLAGLDGSPALGYLKPMIRADRLGQLRYDESLRIGEDYDFVLRLLLADAKMVVIPEPFYLYRRHSASISHRLSVHDMRAMLERQDALAAENSPLSPELSAAFAKRRSMLKTGLAYEKLVASIKARQPAEALGILARDPSHLARLWASFAEGRTRRSELQVAPKRLETITLGAQATTDVEHVVPEYVPTNLVDWSAPSSRQIWRDLAAHANGRCIALDDAGRYAAGFIPEAILVQPEILRQAS